MEACATGTLKGIFEIVHLAGSLSGSEFITAISTVSQNNALTALVTSSGDIFIYYHQSGKSKFKIIPWSSEDNPKPAALAFDPNAEWLLVATEAGSICIIPVGKYLKENYETSDCRFPLNDVVIHEPNGSRAKPSAIVWWQTVTGDASVAIIGTELGELCFVELTSGKDVGGTYITVPVTELYLCQDSSVDTVYLLITGTEDRQWRLVLEQKSQHFMFPLENISPEWDEDDNLGNPLPLVSSSPSPRLRLMNLKQLSVEKFQLLKQRLSEAKYSKKKPLTENKGVDTCDIDEEPDADSTIITPQSVPASNTISGVSATNPVGSSNSIPSTSVSLDVSMTPQNTSDLESTPSISTRPERINKYIYDVVATPQYLKEKCLLAGHYKPNSCLMVYSTDLENTPLYVYKLPQETDQVILQEEIIFALKKGTSSVLSVLSTFHSASTKINGEIDNKIEPVVQEIYLPDGEEVLHIFPYLPFPSSGMVSKTQSEKGEEEGDSDGGGAKGKKNQEMDDLDCDFDYEVDLPSHTKPGACLIVTKTSIYLCQTRKSVENLFMELALGAGDSEAANRLALIFSLDSKLFEIAADAKLRKRCFAPAISLYKQSRCSHVKCSLKFAWAGFVPEFITYMNSLTNGSGGPDLGLEQRKHLATLAVIAHLHQLSLPAGVRTVMQQQTTLRNLLLLIKNNSYYDEILTLVIATATWRWETLQYLASNRGLLLEKLHALLNMKNSPVMASSCNSKENDFQSPVIAPINREKEKGFLHCISDPELRGVLLLNPLLARSHMAFVLNNLDGLDISILRRLAALYDPTQPAIKPFLLSAYFEKPASSYVQVNKSKGTLLPPASDDPIGLETLTQIFLAILIKLNQKRGWKYNQKLLTHIPAQPDKKEPFFDTCIGRNSLACGFGHSIAVIDGLVYSWGLGDFGALGRGPKSATLTKTLQGIDPLLAGEFKELVSNLNSSEYFITKEHSYAVQSPEGADGDCFQPKILSYLSNMKTFNVACGKNFALVITNYGVYGWGNNRYGQLGTGSTGRHPRPVLISALVDEQITRVACGQFHSLAVSRNGRLFTWGWGVHGQLGHGNVEDCLKPTLVKKLSKKKIIWIDAGYAHSVALTDKGEVYAWGCGTYGQVGTGGISKVSSPVKVSFPAPVTHLVSGYFHSVAATSEHKIYMWGSNPACLRVQAQIQKRNRSGQQSQADSSKEESSEELPSDAVKKPASEEETSTKDLSKEPNVNEDNKEAVESTKSDASEEINNSPKSCTKPCVNSHIVSANTVPSCDPMELGHLLPREIEMPRNYGAVKSLSAGNQHSLLLTTHGALYSWGRNMSGQLGTGNRRESVTPVRILDDVHILEVASGADFNLARDSHGQLWGWGSNYYSQLGQGNNSGDEKLPENKVFMLRTSKRVLKVPHSIHSNVEVPRTIANLPTPSSSSLITGQYLYSKEEVDLNELSTLSGMELSSLESPSEVILEKDMMEDKDDGLYGTLTLHTSLSLLHQHYSSKTLSQMLTDCEAHQALATLYKLEKQHNKAMHYQLCALLTQPEIVENEKDLETQTQSPTSRPLPPSHNKVDEAVRILDHFLLLQTEESQSGMRQVLQEGIGLWITHSLPIPKLEDLLLTHLPKTVYPLALLLFGDEAVTPANTQNSKEIEEESVSEATARILSQLSNKFCLNLCSSVINHLQSGEYTVDQLESLKQLAQLNPSAESKTPTTEDAEGSILRDETAELFADNAPDIISLSPTEVNTLKSMCEDDNSEVKGAKSKRESSVGKEQDKDCVLFTCGHHFTAKDFKAQVLPQLERTVTTVPGLLGKTARVLLDQYHSDQPQTACPHCVLAHLTIKLTKHNQPS